MEITRRTALAAGAACMAAAATADAAANGPLLRGSRIAPDQAFMVPVPGGRAYVRMNGNLSSPRPPIVLLHGGPGSSHWYFLNATALAEDRAVILYDQLDSGRSDHPGDAANWTVTRFVEELEAIRQALGVERWHVYGASWGGTIVLEYAARRPRELASAIIQSPLIATDIWLRDARLLRSRMPEPIRNMLDACDGPGAEATPDCARAAEAFNDRHVRRFSPPAAIAAYKSALPRSFSEDIYRHMWGWAEFSATGTLRDYDGTSLLPQLDGARTLFLAGEHDEAMPSTIATFAGMSPGSTFHTIAGAAHAIVNDKPAAWLSVMQDGLSRHDR